MKERYSATYTRARYVGTHPHIAEKSGVYYWNAEQGSFIFRPDTDDTTGKTDWYRVNRENLIDID
jgi:hypothetical protein